jgi:hypothetical protein
MEQEDEEVRRGRIITMKLKEEVENAEGGGLIVVSAQVSATGLTHPATAASVSQTRNCHVGRAD